jgi:hypothetical protein
MTLKAARTHRRPFNILNECGSIGIEPQTPSPFSISPQFGISERWDNMEAV